VEEAGEEQGGHGPRGHGGLHGLNGDTSLTTLRYCAGCDVHCKSVRCVQV
jgi:hypothetical protein